VKPIVVASLALVLGTALLTGCKAEEPAAPAPAAEPVAEPAAVEPPPPPAEPAVDASAPTDTMTDPAAPAADGTDPNAAPPAEGEATESESDIPHSGGDKV
jgi:hypothetical protein